MKGARKPLGKSRSVRKLGQPGRLVTVKLRMSKPNVSRVRRALAKRKRVVVRVKIRARNASGSRVLTEKAARVVRVRGGRVR